MNYSDIFRKATIGYMTVRCNSRKLLLNRTCIYKYSLSLSLSLSLSPKRTRDTQRRRPKKKLWLKYFHLIDMFFLILYSVHSKYTDFIKRVLFLCWLITLINLKLTITCYIKIWIVRLEAFFFYELLTNEFA